MSVNSNLSLLHSEESSAPVSIAELDERFSISPQGSDTQFPYGKAIGCVGYMLFAGVLLLCGGWALSSLFFT